MIRTFKRRILGDDIFPFAVKYCSWCSGNPRLPFILCISLLIETPATEPPQLPGRCPEKEHSSWIPFHGHCYYIESSFTRNWGQASLECLRMGKWLHSCQLTQSHFCDLCVPNGPELKYQKDVTTSEPQRKNRGC